MTARTKKAKTATSHGLLFGTGGVPHSARSSSTIDGIERIKELGLGCMELEFVQKVRMGEQTAAQVSEVAKRNGIRLSAHAPYYINFNSPDPEKVEASKQRLLLTARIGSICGAAGRVKSSSSPRICSSRSTSSTMMEALRAARSARSGWRTMLRANPPMAWTALKTSRRPGCRR